MFWLNRKKREREQKLFEEEGRRFLEEREKEIQRMIEIYQTFDPMIRRLLEELGQSTWGEGYSISAYPYTFSWKLEKETYRTSRIRYTRNYHLELLFDGIEPRKFYVRCLDYKKISTEDVQEESLRRALSKAHDKGPYTYTDTSHDRTR